MMPAIRSRISSSSSTTRISGAINNPFLLIPKSFFFLARVTHRFLPEREDQRHDGAVLPVATVGERDFAAMVFGNLADDGEAQPRALRPRRHIRFGQPVAMLVRQADAVVGDAEGEPVVAQRLDRRHHMALLL